MLLLSLLACTPGEPVHALILTGWEYEWELLSHRVSLIRVEVNQDGAVDLGLIGGSYTTGDDMTDTPYYRLTYADIGVPGASYADASGGWTMGPDPTGTTTLSTPAPDGCDQEIAVFLNGFSINTDIPQTGEYPEDYDEALGYTSNGFGFALGEPVLADGTLSVDVTATVRWAPQDREDMNGAIPFAQTGVSAHVLFVCFQGDLAAAQASGSAGYPFDPPYTDQEPLVQTFDAAGKANDGVLGISGFDLLAEFTNLDGTETGDYLRSYGVELAGADDGLGTWSGTTTAQITNSSALEFGELTASFTADYTRVGVRGAVTAGGSLEGTHDVGETTVTIP